MKWLTEKIDAIRDMVQSAPIRAVLTALVAGGVISEKLADVILAVLRLCGL